MAENIVDHVTYLLSRVPGLGPRSAKRAVLHLLKKRTSHLDPLIEALADLRSQIRTCSHCGNFDQTDPCTLCADARRDSSQLCVIADVADLWALERTASYRGRYHVLGGLLSALDGVGPEDLRVQPLLDRIEGGGIAEVILALGATLDGQTTSHYLADRLAEKKVTVTRLAHGLPVGGELGYLDDGTLIQALKARQNF
ncbi:MAG TPA: recombination mediator RecR [Dongiaceae bacterium]|jgi:recombination protein RecR|nr:recombination mediator RecR [Dongiaceae bacterium]